MDSDELSDLFIYLFIIYLILLMKILQILTNRKLCPMNKHAVFHKTMKYFLCNCFAGVTHRHLSDHMSELVENTLSDLNQSKVRQCSGYRISA